MVVNYGFEETLGEEQDQFTAGGASYPWMSWMNGIKRVKSLENSRDGNTVIGQVAGWCLKTGMNAYLDEICEFLCGEWDQEQQAAETEKRDLDWTLHAEKVVLLHSGGDKKEYFHFLFLEFFPLAFGVPNQYAILRNDGRDGNPTQRIGVVNVWLTDKDRTTNQWKPTANSHTKILAVVKRFHDAGYRDSDGSPAPVMLSTKSTIGQDFYAILQSHANVVIKYLRESLKQTMAPFYAFSISTYPDEQATSVGKGDKKSDVFHMRSAVPAMGKCDQEYTDAHFCGADLIRPLLTVTREKALPWCDQNVTYAIVNQVQSGKWKGPIPASAQEALGQQGQEQAQVSMPSRAGAPVQQQPPAQQFANEKQVEWIGSLITFFNKHDRADLAEALQTTLDGYEPGEMPYDVAYAAIEDANRQKKEIEAAAPKQTARPTAAGFRTKAK